MPSQQKDQNVGPFRRVKRAIREQIGWNKMKMSTQLWFHLGCTFFWFFIVYFGIMFAYTSVAYVSEILKTVEGQLDLILQDRLEYSTQALATMFYMIDKLGIDSSKRLSGVYQSTLTTDPFPIREDAPGYELYDWPTLQPGQRVYNAGASCKDNANAPAPMKQLKHIWEQSLLMGIGPRRDVNAERIIFLFDDNTCVYPAQNMDNLPDWKSQPFWSEAMNSPQGYFIDRKTSGYFNNDNPQQGAWDNKYMTYWTKHDRGLIGLQLSHSDYDNLLPSSVLEEPYSLSFITVFDKDWSLIWDRPEKIDPAYYAQAKRQIQEGGTDKVYQTSELVQKQAEDGEEPIQEGQDDLEKLTSWKQRKVKIEQLVMEDLTKYDVWKEPSPLDEDAVHTLYNERYKMYVVCGQKDSLKVTIQDNLRSFVTRDLTWFQLFGLMVNIIILLMFLFIFQRRLHKRVTQPIQNLTKSIKNPKEFQKMKQVADKQKSKANKGKKSNDYLDAEEEEGFGIDGAEISVEKKTVKDDVEKRNQAIDEVQALEGIFYTFFGNQDKNKRNVLVEMSPLESSLNPFYIEKPQDGNNDSENGDDSRDRFMHLPKKLEQQKSNDIVGPESVQFRLADNQDDDVPTGMSIDEEPAFVDVVIPRLQPDWKDYYMDS